MLTVLLDNKLYLAPVDSKQCRHVLDLGCGTGIWAMDFADLHPNCQVTGIDLSPIQPSMVPPNCQFVIDDITDEWTYPRNHFDFIHMRCLMGSISDWQGLYRHIYNHLAPGGWIQHMDMNIQFTSDDGTIAEGHIMDEWSKVFIDCGERIGKTFSIADKAEGWIREAGFEEVNVRWYKVPVGKWPKDGRMKEVGICNFHYCYEGAEGWALYLLTKVLGWKVEEAQIFVAKFRNALKDGRNHGYYPV